MDVRAARPHTAVFLAALAVRLGVLYALRGHILLQPAGEMDSAVYLALARSGPPPVAYYLSPLYLYFLRWSGASISVALVLQVLLGSVGTVLAYDTARRWFGARGAVVTAVLLLLTGVLTFNEAILLQSALDPFLTALTLWILTLALQRDGKALLRFAAAGAAVGLFALNRPNVLVWLVAFPALLILRREVRAAGAFLAGGLLLLAPVLVRNYVVAHEVVLVSSHGGLNFYVGNSEEADGTYHALRDIRPTIEGQSADSRRVAERAVGRPLSAGEVSRWFYGRAFAWIAAHPGDAFLLFLRKLGYTVHQTDLALNYSYDFFAHDVASPLRFLIAGPWILVPLGVAGAATRWRDRRFVTWFAFVPVYAVSVAVFFVASRYRLPLLVALAVAAAGIVDVRRGATVVAGLLAAVIALWPFGLDSGRSDEQTNLVVRLIERRQFAEAEARIREWEAGHREPARLHHQAALQFEAAGDPARAAVWFEQVLRDPAAQPVLRSSALDALARLHARAGRLAEARRVLAMEDRRSMSAARALALGRLALEVEDGNAAVDFLNTALRQDPSSGPAWHSLGVAHLALQQNRAALHALTRARSLMPDDPPNCFFLAIAQAQAGQRDEARQSAQRAVQLRPGFVEARRLLERLEQR